MEGTSTSPSKGTYCPVSKGDHTSIPSPAHKGDSGMLPIIDLATAGLH